jgi:hypothetical protein
MWARQAAQRKGNDRVSTHPSADASSVHAGDFAMDPSSLFLYIETIAAKFFGFYSSLSVSNIPI